MILTNLGEGHQIRHALKIVGGKIGVASRLDFRQGLIDLCT